MAVLQTTNKTLIRILILLSFAIFVMHVQAANAADREWMEVRSPHFRVLTDGSEKEAREVARGFEQIRAVFATLLPGMRLETGTPFLIVAPNDEQSAKNLLPLAWKRKGTKPAGFYQGAWEKEFAMVRLDVLRQQSNSQIASSAFEVVYHEYTHSIMRANFRWLPTWLNEGLAEFYGNTRIEQSRVLVGAPSQRAAYVGDRSIFAIEKLIGITPASKEYHDERDVQLFYFESWGLVHYLMITPQMEQGKKLKDFLTLLEKGVDQKKAFQDAIGDIKTVENQLDIYLDSHSLNSFVLPNPPDIRSENFVTRKLTSIESSAELGLFQLWLSETAAARAHIELALKANPQSGLAHEAMGFIDFAEGRDAESVQEFENAVRLDSSLYLSDYFRIMMSPLARSEREEDRKALRAALTRVLIENPDFPAARIQMASLSIRERDLNAALNYALQAQRLAPARAGYNTLIGNILYGLGRHEEAAALARYVAERWESPDRDEAIELWGKLPAEKRGETPTTAGPPNGTSVISGKIESESCNVTNSTMNLSIDGKTLTFSTKSYTGGFSDTLWFGADHFSFCHHLEGLRAVIWYKPATDSRLSGELTRMDIRDDITIR